MTGYEFIDYLEEKGFEVNRKSMEDFYKRLQDPKLRKRTMPRMIVINLTRNKPYLEANCFPGIINVYIDREENIRVDCIAGYYNSAYDEDCQYYRYYILRTYDEAVKVIDRLMTSNPITEKMCKTILYDYNGLKHSKDELEDMRLNEEEYKDDLNKFLEKCGFNSFEEYKEYIDSLE